MDKQDRKANSEQTRGTQHVTTNSKSKVMSLQGMIAIQECELGVHTKTTNWESWEANTRRQRKQLSKPSQQKTRSDNIVGTHNKKPQYGSKARTQSWKHRSTNQVVFGEPPEAGQGEPSRLSQGEGRGEAQTSGTGGTWELTTSGKRGTTDERKINSRALLETRK